MKTRQILPLCLLVILLLSQSEWNREPAKITGAFGSLEFWQMSRAYPGTQLPEGKLQAAWEKVSAMRSEHSRDEVPPPWHSLGPVNIGGRTLSLAFNPQNPMTLWAGSASGGLWRSHTGGFGAEAWFPVETGFPVLGVGAIAVASEDSMTIYIGTGEVYHYRNADGGLVQRTTRGSYGIGILKSTDGGETWQKSLDWSMQEKRGVQALAINPQNSSTLFAATSEGTWRSRDAGNTWTQVHSAVMATDLVFAPNDTTTIYMASGCDQTPGFGIYRSRDAGDNWTRLSGGLPEDWYGKTRLAVTEQMPDAVFASIGKHNGYNGSSASFLMRSLDGGDTWFLACLANYSSFQGWYSHDLAICPSDSMRVLAAGIKVWRSENMGEDLQAVSESHYIHDVPPAGGPEGPPEYCHVDVHAIEWMPGSADVAYFATDGGVFCSEDLGDSYLGLNGGFQTTQFYNGFSSSSQDSMLAIGGLQDNYTAIYEGTGEWRRALFGDGGWSAIHPDNDDIRFGSYQWLKNLYRTSNGGDYWEQMDFPEIGDACFLSPFLLCPSRPERMYAGRSYLLRSDNTGSEWTVMNSGSEIDGNPILSMGVSHSNEDVLYCATAPVSDRSRVYRSSDGGQTLQEITGSLPDRYPVDLCVDPQNDQTLYLSFGGFGTSHLFRSQNAGASWEDIGAGLPDLPCNAVCVDPLSSGNLYVGNDLGVFASEDGGASWFEFFEGLPEAVIVMDLEISETNRALRCASHGRGVFERPLLPVDVTSSVTPSPELSLSAYPNPFNPQTTIRMSLTRSSRLRLRVHDARGRLVRELVSGEFAAGEHRVQWDGRSDQGQELASGVYFARLVSKGDVSQLRLILLR
ncbi:MAG: FlgD immunoglobulin-like domain containing protein [Candidatus Krumholzibacteria bacterium]|nr:FlgD immunoglobulin-like domain containing protein [Candidatus Krumholzibacteria bacterium]